MNKSENKPLKPAPHGFPYLKIHCQKCGSLVTHCKESKNKAIATCPFGHKQKYKIVVNIPGEEEARKTFTIGTRHLPEAMQQAMTKANEVQGNKIQLTTEKIIQLPYTIDSAVSRYIGALHGDKEIVSKYEFKVKSRKHLNDCERFLKYYVLSLKSFYGVEELPIKDINNKDATDEYLDYLMETKNLSNSSFNKAVIILRAFYNYLINEGYQIKNPFKSIPRRQTTQNIETISDIEYQQLSEIVQNEKLGEYKIKNNRPQKERPKKDEYVKSWYKEWMKDAIDLGLFTGRRNNEIVSMKWNDIFKDENGELHYIRVPDFKVNRQKGNDAAHLKYIYVPVTLELRELLYHIGYENYQGSEKYILAPEEKMARENINFFISKSFTHYVKQLHLEKKLNFKNLRKTYISRLTSLIGIENARIITRHSSTDIMKSNYIDQRMIARTARDLTMIGNEENRKRELDNIRNSNPENQLER